MNRIIKILMRVPSNEVQQSKRDFVLKGDKDRRRILIKKIA